MASTRDYLEYLNHKIDIAPVNSEEEYRAAELIESLMQSHGLETRLQDIEARGGGELAYRICGIVMFLGVFLSGILETPAAIVGELLVLVCLVLLGIRFLGIANPLGNLGGTINSQNVIGVHRATGPLVAKGSRPIVIVAHYDTPRENLLYAPPFDRWQRLLRRYAPQCVCVAAVFALIQTFGFVPAGIRHLFWVLAIVAALPQLLVGIAAIQERLAPCTEGSNDNKSGVAAMLGVMAMVHPGDDEATGYGERREQRDRQAAERLAREAAEAEALAAAEAEALAAAEAEELAEAEFDEYEEQAEPEGDVYEPLDEPVESDTNILTLVGEDAGYDEAEASETLVTEPVYEEIDTEETGEEPEGPVDEFGAYEGAEAYDEPEEYDAYDEGYAGDEPYEESEPYEEPEPEIVVRREVQVERVEGVRHGRETLEALRILPEGCEIVYVEPEVRVRTYEEEVMPNAIGSGATAEGAYAEYSDYDDEYDEDGYWDGQEEPRGGLLDRARGLFSRARQSIADRLAARRERKDAEELPELEDDAYDVLDAEIESEGEIEYEGEVDPGDADAEPYDAEDEPDNQGELLVFETAEVIDESDIDEPSMDEGVDVSDDLGPGPSVDEFGVTAVTPVISEEDALIDEVYSVIDGGDEEPPTMDGTLPFVPLGELIDGREVDERGDSKDTTGLDTLATDATVIASRGADVAPTPLPPDDPTWGQTSFRPEVSNVARRAVLFDLPDPMGSTGSSDPLDTGKLLGARDGAAPTDADASNANDRPDGGWKGGGTRRSDLRVVEDDDVRVQEDVREAILGMGDDALVAHDIWFVALGGSHADQAGMKAFLEDNRRSVRGCFLINLTCVGAGQLAVFTQEGLAGTRRADRRVVRLLDQVANDLHIDLLHAKHDWEDTDATPALRSSLRCATISGITADEELALSKVPGDEPDLVNPAQTTRVAELVAELIRRS